MKDQYELFATAPRGTTAYLMQELAGLGAQSPTESAAGVSFSGTLETAYRALLWSRVASRVLLILAKFPAFDSDSLYAGVRSVDWNDHMTKASTFAVDAVALDSSISNSHFASLRVKDAVCDQFREKVHVRPTVEINRPRVRLNLYLSHDQAVVALDLAGEGLHRRGYREDGGGAPLKENLAAAVLLAAGWPAVAAAGGSLVDPLAGSGTFLVEGAMMATDTAPGLLRDYWSVTGWKGHDERLWEALRGEARERAAKGREKLPPIVGSDADPKAVRAAQGNIFRAGLAESIRVRPRDLGEMRPPENPRSEKGLLVTNPPYGERMGGDTDLADTYTRLGELLRTHFNGFSAAVLTGNPLFGKFLGVSPSAVLDFMNGPIPCKLFKLDIAPGRFFSPPPPGPVPRYPRPEEEAQDERPPRDGEGSFRPRFERKPYIPRSGGGKPWEKKPYGERAGDGERKPWESRERKPWKEREAGASRDGGEGPAGVGEGSSRPRWEKKPYVPRPEGGKPWEKKPYGERSGGERKPWEKRESEPGREPGGRTAEEGGERPRRDFEKKSYVSRSGGGKPWEKKPYGDRAGGREKKPWENRERKPFRDRDAGPEGGREGGPGMEGDGTSRPRFEKKPFTPRAGGSKPWEKKPFSPRAGGGKPWEKKSPGERPEGGKPWEKKPFGKPSEGGKPWEKKSSADRPGGGKPWEKKPFSPRAGGGKPWEKKSPGERPEGGKPWEKKPFSPRSGAGKPWDKKPAGDRSEGGKPWEKKPFGKPAGGGKPWAKKPFAPRAEGGAAPGDKPARDSGKPGWVKKPFAGKPSNFSDRKKSHGSTQGGRRPGGGPGAGKRPLRGPNPKGR